MSVGFSKNKSRVEDLVWKSSEILSNANWQNEVATILGEIRAFKLR